MTTDARALIAAGLAHDEAMTAGQPACECSGAAWCEEGCPARPWLDACQKAEEWFEKNRRTLLTGYSDALDSLESAHRHTDALERDKREACKTEEHLRTELGEAKLVIEQQDRDLERMRAGLEKLRASVTEWGDGGFYNDAIDAILNERTPCTDTTTK